MTDKITELSVTKIKTSKDLILYLFAVVAIILLCCVSSFGQIVCYVTTDLNVRSAPSINSTILGKLSVGTKITVDDEGYDQSDWLEIHFNSQLGYISTKYLTKKKLPSGTISQEETEVPELIFQDRISSAEIMERGYHENMSEWGGQGLNYSDYDNSLFDESVNTFADLEDLDEVRTRKKDNDLEMLSIIFGVPLCIGFVLILIILLSRKKKE